jgi:hypothetical protein
VFSSAWSSYDTYTPTRNIVFHDYGQQANGHGNNEWFKRQKDRFRKGSIDRVKTTIQIGNPSTTVQANLGIYGIGKRRSIQQLEEFVNINIADGVGNTGPEMKCSGASWIPYQASISPVENMFENPDNLDPQPEYPLRTALVYYEQVEVSTPSLDLDLNTTAVDQQEQQQQGPEMFAIVHEQSTSGPPLSLLFLLWVLGLIVWYALFSSSGRRNGPSPRKKPIAEKGE